MVQEIISCRKVVIERGSNIRRTYNTCILTLAVAGYSDTASQQEAFLSNNTHKHSCGSCMYVL